MIHPHPLCAHRLSKRCDPFAPVLPKEPSYTSFTFHLLTRIPPEGNLSCSTGKAEITLGNLGWDQPTGHSCFHLTVDHQGTQGKEISPHIQLWNTTNSQCLEALMLISAPIPWQQSEPCKGHTHGHTHIRDWVSDQPPLNWWDFPGHLLPVGAGPFAFIHRRLPGNLTWKMCHWECTEGFLLSFEATKATGSKREPAVVSTRAS